MDKASFEKAANAPVIRSRLRAMADWRNRRRLEILEIRLPAVYMDARMQSTPSDPAATGKKRRVLFVPGYFFEETLIGIAEFARDNGWELNSYMRFQGKFPSLEGADGIIATSVTPATRDWLAHVKDIPIVHAEFSQLPGIPYPSVEPDYIQAGELAAQHFLEAGLAHFLYYPSPGNAPVACEGFERLLSASGKSVTSLEEEATRSAFPFTESRREHRIPWLAAALKDLPRPMGILADDDSLSTELVEACQLAGLKVPEDVAIVGCDNRAVELALSPISLSSVDMDFRRIGYRAAAVLGELMGGGQKPTQTIKIPPAGMVVRRSSATYVCDSPGITAAMRHLREHFQESLRIADLARVAGLSLRVFQMEFKKYAGHTAMDELQRLRLRHVERLLRETDLKLEAVAVECGFASGRYMSEVFLAAKGVRPSKWRESTQNAFALSADH